MRLLLLLAAAVVGAAAADTPSGPVARASWHYLPPAAYLEEPLHLELADAAGWHGLDDRGEALAGQPTGDGGLRLVATIGDATRLRAIGPGYAELGVRLVRPGSAAGLRLADGALTFADEPAVLVLSRIDARADRRWALLRRWSRPDPTPCANQLAGDDLASLVVASQALDLAGQGLLVRLPGGDRLRGWKHREYRQALAWLVADALGRGAGPIVLVEPCAPKADEDLVKPLVQATRDVAIAYQCHLVETGAVADHRYWEIAPGLLGERLNPQGEKAAAELMAAWMPR